MTNKQTIEHLKAERAKLLVHLICSFDRSPEANVNDYTTDMGNLRHIVDLMLNKGEDFDGAKESADLWKNRKERKADYGL